MSKKPVPDKNTANDSSRGAAGDAFPIVGIGASAGGLAAFESFFSGMAFVLVQHLARDRKEKAIAVVLSGTGSDGALGLRAVKGEGGMLMVQSPESTEFDGMPRSAISTGEKENSLRTIFNMLRSHSGHDFSHYKPNTVLRRIERRLALLQLDSIEKYVERIRQESEELDALFLWKGRCKTRRETGFQCAFCPTGPWTML